MSLFLCIILLLYDDFFCSRHLRRDCHKCNLFLVGVIFWAGGFRFPLSPVCMCSLLDRSGVFVWPCRDHYMGQVCMYWFITDSSDRFLISASARRLALSVPSSCVRVAGQQQLASGVCSAETRAKRLKLGSTQYNFGLLWVQTSPTTTYWKDWTEKIDLLSFFL